MHLGTNYSKKICDSLFYCSEHQLLMISAPETTNNLKYLKVVKLKESYEKCLRIFVNL